MTKYFGDHLELFGVGLLAMVDLYFLLFELSRFLFFVNIVFEGDIIASFFDTSCISLIQCFVIFFILIKEHLIFLLKELHFFQELSFQLLGQPLCDLNVLR